MSSSQYRCNDPADLAAIMAIENKLAQYNPMDDIIDYYADDAIVLDVYAPGIFRGRSEIHAGFEEGLQTLETFTGNITDSNILSSGNLAAAALQVRFDVTLKNGQKVALQLRQLDAFKKVNGKWLIVQQHISFPVDAKTGMGVLNGPLPVRGPVQWPANPLPGPAVSREQGIAEIHQFLDRGVVVPNVDALMEYYGPTDDLIVYDMLYPPGEFRGMRETRDGFAPVMNYTAPKVEMLELVVDSDGLLAIQIDVQDITVTEQDGSQRNFGLRQSDCLRRVGDRWYSVFEMCSVPIDPSTGKAVLESARIAGK